MPEEADSTVVLDISSDDDVAWGGGGVTASGGDGGSVGCRDDGDWISELLGEVVKEKEDDSDDVVVVGEVIVKPKLRVSHTLVKCGNKVREDTCDDDDDECLVLDGDPDKPVSIQKDKGGGEEDDSDDLLVVSEKGPVACRDYPHARHLCVKFPFNSTPHENHCDQCHCYVCDSLAPCIHWSSGNPAIDHCHATDKEDFWKNQRQSVKKSNGTLPVVSVVPEISPSVGQSPPCQISSSLPSEPVQRYVAPNVTTPPVTQYYSRDKYQPPVVSHQLQDRRNNVIRGDRRRIGINAGSQVISRTPFRRAMTPTVNQYSNTTYQSNYPNQFRRYPLPGIMRPRWVHRGGVTPVPNTFKDSSRANVGGLATNLMPHIPTQTNVGSAMYTPVQPQIIPRASPIQPQIIPRAHGVRGNKNTEGLQHQVSSQMNVGSNFNSPMIAQSAIGTGPNWGHTFDNPLPFQSQGNSSLERARVSQNSGPFLSRSTTFPSNAADCYYRSFPSQPNAGNAFESSSAYQSQVCTSTTSTLNAGEHVLAKGVYTQSAMQSSSADAHQTNGFSPDASLLNAGENLTVQTNTIQNGTLSNSAVVDDGLVFQRSCDNQPQGFNQLQNAVQRDGPHVSLDGNSELPVSTDFFPLDLQFDPWIFENESGLDAVGNPLFCPEATIIEGGLFDV